MSWECKYLNETFCEKRKQECDPGAKGCVLQGKFSFPLKEKTKSTKTDKLHIVFAKLSRLAFLFTERSGTRKPRHIIVARLFCFRFYPFTSQRS